MVKNSCNAYVIEGVGIKGSSILGSGSEATGGGNMMRATCKDFCGISYFHFIHMSMFNKI